MTRGVRRGSTRIVAAIAAVGIGLIGLVGCGSTVKSASGGSSSGKSSCGNFRIAMNPWVGYTADGAVVGYVAKHKLGCNVSYVNGKEEVSWQGMNSGTVDTVLENWGHPDLVKKYVDQLKSVVDAGQTGNKGIIGWYVPPWLAKAHPDITDWKNLNKYASLFKTSESGGKGQLLDGDPSYVTNDEALVKNLNLDYKVVVSGSEAGLIQSFKTAEKNHTGLLAYFYEPQWFFSDMKLVKIDLPPYKTGCDADPKKVNCDYPPYNLNKLMAKKFADSGSPAADLVKNFNWTNADQNQVAEYIAKDHMSNEEAAKKWVDANPDKVKAWLG
jgi:glycine betaine/proline transport system substrate-binding protein